MKEKIIFGVPVRLKSESWLMKAIAFISKPFNPTFMERYWTTFFGKVYAPTSFDIENESLFFYYKEVLHHEGIHIADQKKYPIWFPLTYIFPPVIFAYGRFYWERKAYLPELKDLHDEIDLAPFEERLDQVVNDLGGPGYFWAWPKAWVRKWFNKQLGIK